MSSISLVDEEDRRAEGAEDDDPDAGNLDSRRHPFEGRLDQLLRADWVHTNQEHRPDRFGSEAMPLWQADTPGFRRHCCACSESHIGGLAGSSAVPRKRQPKLVAEGREECIQMAETPRLTLVSREDGQAVIRIGYEGKHAELRLAKIEVVRDGPSFEDLVRKEVHALMDALDQWTVDPEHGVETQ
jgi:hypothetical protein